MGRVLCSKPISCVHVDVQDTSSAASLPQLTHSAAGTGLALAESSRFVFFPTASKPQKQDRDNGSVQFVLKAVYRIKIPHTHIQVH